MLGSAGRPAPRGPWRKRERRLEAERTALFMPRSEKMDVRMDMCGASAGFKPGRDQSRWRSCKGNVFIRLPTKKSSGLGIRGGTISSGSEHPSSVWPKCLACP